MSSKHKTSHALVFSSQHAPCCDTRNYVRRAKQNTLSEQNPGKTQHREKRKFSNLTRWPCRPTNNAFCPTSLVRKESMAFPRRVSNNLSSLDMFIRVSLVCVIAYLRTIPSRHLHRTRSVAASTVNLDRNTGSLGWM